MTGKGCGGEATSAWDGPSAPPSALYGDLFAAVQARRLFANSKTFADAVPRRPPAEIMAAWRAAGTLDDAGLRRFVATHFTLPPNGGGGVGSNGARSLRRHIAATWDRLVRPPVAAGGSALAVGRRHVVPGGRFRELYYWDSYFTLLGLARDRPDLADDLVDCFTDLIERHGHVPNGTRSYYLSRSQPPVYALMPPLTPAGWTARRRAALAAEYRFWMTGGRAVRLSDGAVLNRYWDDADGPRDESWREDVALARVAGRPERELWRDLRAGAESGWDFSSRWLGDGAALVTIRTTRILPVDLNALLFAVERTLGLDTAADARRAAIDRWLWHDGYHDLDLDRGPTDVISAAALFPLFAGCASPAQAAAVARLAEARLLAPGGLRTTLAETGQQWDAPNGWAPLQWIAVDGLHRYGFDPLADRIADAWIGTVARHFAATREMLEKYDVEGGGAGGGGEYAVQDGFGWTNGVTAALIDRRSALSR